MPIEITKIFIETCKKMPSVVFIISYNTDYFKVSRGQFFTRILLSNIYETKETEIFLKNIL